MVTLAPPPPSPRPLAGIPDIARSEFRKLRSVRSTFWTLFAAVTSNVVIAAFAAILLPGQLGAHEKATVDAVRLSLAGLHLAQIAFGVLGVLVITSEYGTGMIHATVSAVPRRRTLLASKAMVFTGTALIVGITASFAAYFTFQAFLSDDSLRSSLADPGVVRAVAGGGLFLTVLGLLGLGLGAIIRVSAGAIAALFSLLFLPPILLDLLPHSWQTDIGPYIPMNAGGQIYLLHHDDGNLGAWTGFGVFSLYAALALTAGFILINHRDT
ncbi:ABC transporter permease [Frankia sp. AvcI1]|uniref:ABC transporter permease n=2 Tax=Frankia TaxID=1854 RepID=UPI002117902C|nr:ABC transporter permease [Frankia sp. AvcI1]